MACAGEPEPSVTDAAKVVSRTIRDMELFTSDNGVKQRIMRAPLREEHAFARPAFETFSEGVEVIGYDSLGQPSSRVVADYALHWTERDLWELNGNVVVEGDEGQKLYTQQLRWDRSIGKIYSNVDCKIEENGVVSYVEGFEAAEDFSYYTFRRTTGTFMVEVETSAEATADSTAVDIAAPAKNIQP